MHRLICLSAAAILLSGCAGGRPVTATRYGPAGLLGGYSERIVEPGVWRVTGRSNGIAEYGFGRNMAMYRAAEIVKAAGFPYVQVLDQRGRSQSIRVGGGSSTSAGESMELWVRGAQGPEAPTDCRADDVRHCFTLSVEEVMARLRPLLHIAPEPDLTGT